MNDDPDNVVNSKYYSKHQMQSLKIANKNKSLSMLHINTCSLNKNFYNLKYLLKCANNKINDVDITETRTTRYIFKLCNISLKNYAVESSPTES